MSNRQWWEATWANIYELPSKVRLVIRFNLGESQKEWIETHGHTADSFYTVYSKYSYPRCTKYLRNAQKERLVQLYATEYNTYIPDVGYKTKHYRTGEDVYVIESGRSCAKARDGDRPQEYVQIVSKLDWGWGKEHEQNFITTCQHRQHNVNPRYVDNLPKKHREALALLKILDVDGYIDGIGYRKVVNRYVGWNEDERRSVYKDTVVYFIDAVKREDEDA